MNENDIGRIIVDTAVRLHKDVGPGLMESVYEKLLAHRLREKGLKVEEQVIVPIECDGIQFETGFRADLIVERSVIIELKSTEATHPAHKKQVLTYLKLTDMRLGFLLNFGQAVMLTGITRLVNKMKE